MEITLKLDNIRQIIAERYYLFQFSKAFLLLSSIQDKQQENRVVYLGPIRHVYFWRNLLVTYCSLQCNSFAGTALNKKPTPQVDFSFSPIDRNEPIFNRMNSLHQSRFSI